MTDSRIIHLHALVCQFLRDRNLETDVEVNCHAMADGSDIMALRPKRQGAARVELQTLLLPDNEWEVDVFVEDDERPIELLGPRDLNSSRSDRQAEVTLMRILDFIARGIVFMEETSESDSIGIDVPDPDDYDPSYWAGRTSFEPWGHNAEAWPTP